MAPVDREYFYGSLDRKIFGQYLELFSDFKYVRGFLGRRVGADAVYAGRIHGRNSSIRNKHREGISVPIQNPFNPFTVPDYTSPGGFDPKHPETKVSAAPPGTGFTTGVHYAGLEAGLRTDKITTNNFELPPASEVIWVSSAITLRHGSGKAGSAIARTIAMRAWAES